MPSAASRDRQSFSESLRGVPPSPRAQRQPSLTQAAVQELIDNPPTRNAADPAFHGRDWRSITVGELVSPGDLRFVEIDTGIEAATNVRASSPIHSRGASQRLIFPLTLFPVVACANNIIASH